VLSLWLRVVAVFLLIGAALSPGSQILPRMRASNRARLLHSKPAGHSLSKTSFRNHLFAVPAPSRSAKVMLGDDEDDEQERIGDSAECSVLTPSSTCLSRHAQSLRLHPSSLRPPLRC
jgi:hypothetical protein